MSTPFDTVTRKQHHQPLKFVP